MKNIPNMISQFIASSDESRNYSLTKNYRFTIDMSQKNMRNTKNMIKCF